MESETILLPQSTEKSHNCCRVCKVSTEDLEIAHKKKCDDLYEEKKRIGERYDVSFVPDWIEQDNYMNGFGISTHMLWICSLCLLKVVDSLALYIDKEIKKC